MVVVAEPLRVTIQEIVRMAFEDDSVELRLESDGPMTPATLFVDMLLILGGCLECICLLVCFVWGLFSPLWNPSTLGLRHSLNRSPSLLVSVIRRSRFATFPDILVLQVRRFAFENLMPKKLGLLRLRAWPSLPC